MYWYVLVCTSIWYLVLNFSRFWRVHPWTYWWFLSTYFEFLNILPACRAQPVCLQGIHALAHALNQSTLYKPIIIRFINCCLAAPLPVPASARPGAGAGLLGDAAAEGCFARLAYMMISGQPVMHCAWRARMGVWRTWASRYGVDHDEQYWNVEDVTAKYWSILPVSEI
jgi:hypothetical protein